MPPRIKPPSADRGITVFATNTVGGRIADLEVRHRLRARAEDRIRGLKDTGMTNLPLQAFAKNQIWLELACLAYELLAWDPGPSSLTKDRG